MSPAPPASQVVAPVRETGADETLLISIGASVAVLGAIGALLAQDLVGSVVAVLGVLLLPVAAAGPVLWPTGTAARLRNRWTQPVVGVGIVVAAVVLVRRLDAAGGDPGQLVGGLGRTLGPLVVLLVLAQLAGAVTIRHLAVVLAGCAVAAVLALASVGRVTEVDVTSGLGAALLLTWAGVVPTAWLLTRAMNRLRSHATAGQRWAPPAGTAALLVGVPLVLALLALLLPPPSGLRPPSSGLDGVTGTGLGGTGSGTTSRSPQGYLSGDMDLDARGDLPDTELVRVPAASPVLWGSGTMSVYTGSGWRADDGGEGVTRLPQRLDGSFDPLAEPGAPAGVLPGGDRTDWVQPEPGVLLPVLSPGQAVSVTTEDPFLGRLRGGTVFGSQPGTPYAVRSVADVVEQVRPSDLSLPPMPTRVGELAERLTRDAPTAADKVAAIEDYLRRTMRYDLDSPVPDDDEDSVDDFLFESHEGFCEHFASAEAVLLRTVGVPTRVVTGFAGGEPRGDERVMLGSDAHAWVQVHVGGDHWIWTDPTAGATLAEDHDPAAAVGDWIRDHGTGLLLALGLLLAAALAGWLLVARARRRRRARLAAAAPLSTKVLVAFALLERTLAGTPLERTRTTSVADWSRVLGSSLHGVRLETFDVVQRVLYDRGPVDHGEGLPALDDLTALTARALAYRDSRGSQRWWARGWRWVRSARVRRSATSTGTPRTSGRGPSSPASSTTST